LFWGWRPEVFGCWFWAIGTQGHERIVADFVEAVRQDREPMIPPASARLSVELILALYESARQGKMVQLQ
jgi:predicted dehydrogenase